jgi:phosphoglycolate phosphatase
MRKYDTVIFDLDGTLLDTLEDLTDSVNYAIRLYGYPSRTITEMRDFVGNGIARMLELSIPGGTQNPNFEKCVEHFRRHYASNMQSKTKPYDGILALLRELAGKEYKMAVVSNKPDPAVKALCRYYFGDLIGAAVGESERISKKPAPDAVLEVLKALESSPDSAIYVGDSEVDARTAKNTRLPFVGVTWGFRGRDVLEKEGARYMIDHPAELPGILEDHA